MNNWSTFDICATIMLITFGICAIELIFIAL